MANKKKADKKMIVAVDDSNIMLKKLSIVLGEEYDLHAFSVGSRALKFLNDRTPDLVILDIDMPEINGYQMLETIRETEHLEKVPVLFLTSNSEKNYVIKALVGGANDYVVKPIEEEILKKKVRAALKNASGERPS